jgi:hypothetical protein
MPSPSALTGRFKLSKICRLGTRPSAARPARNTGGVRQSQPRFPTLGKDGIKDVLTLEVFASLSPGFPTLGKDGIKDVLTPKVFASLSQGFLPWVRSIKSFLTPKVLASRGPWVYDVFANPFRVENLSLRLANTSGV